MWRTWRSRAGGTWGCRKPKQGGYEDTGARGQGCMGAWSTGVMGTPSGGRGSQRAEMAAEGAAVSPRPHPPGPGPGLFIALQHTGTLGAEASHPLPGPFASPGASSLLPRRGEPYPGAGPSRDPAGLGCRCVPRPVPRRDGTWPRLWPGRARVTSDEWLCSRRGSCWGWEHTALGNGGPLCTPCASSTPLGAPTASEGQDRGHQQCPSPPG